MKSPNSMEKSDMKNPAALTIRSGVLLKLTIELTATRRA